MTAIEAPAVGLHQRIPYAVYAGWSAARHSALRRFEDSAAHAREALTNPEETRPQALGTALHTALLEPELFEASYYLVPEIDRRYKAGKDTWDALKKEHAGTPKQPLLYSDQVVIRGVLRSLEEHHPTALELLRAPGLIEPSLYWIDPTTKEPCKSRPDKLTRAFGFVVVVDLKSCRKATAWRFSKDCDDFAYHESAAMQLEGLDQVLGKHPRRFVHMAIEKTPPYGIQCFELEEEELLLGRERFARHLVAFSSARKSGVWPSYPDGIVPLKLPRYVFTREQEFSEWH